MPEPTAWEKTPLRPKKQTVIAVMESGLAIGAIVLVMGFCLLTQSLHIEFILFTALAWGVYALLPWVDQSEALLVKIPWLGKRLPPDLCRTLAIMLTGLIVACLLVPALANSLPVVKQQVSTFSRKLPGYIDSSRRQFHRLLGQANTPQPEPARLIYVPWWNYTHLRRPENKPNPLQQDFNEASRTITAASNASLAKWLADKPGTAKALHANLSALEAAETNPKHWKDGLQAIQKTLLQGLLTLGSNTAQASIYALSGLVLGFYFLLDGRSLLPTAIDAYWPEESKQQARRFIRQWHLRTQELVQAQVASALIAGLLFWLVYKSLGLPYASLLAWLMGLGSLIPVLGSWLGILPAVLLTVVLGSEVQLLLFMLLVMGFIWFRQRVLKPRLIPHHVKMHPTLGILLFLINYQLAGLWGVLLTPLTLALVITWYNTSKHTNNFN